MIANFFQSLSQHGVEYLLLDSQGGSKVTLVNTEVNFIRGGIGIDNITTGWMNTKAVVTEGGNDIVKTGAGWVGLIETSTGNDQVTIGRGGAGRIGTGAGNDIVVAYLGLVDSIETDTGNDSVTVSGKGGAGQIRTGDGNDVILLASNVESLDTGPGDDIVTRAYGWLGVLDTNAGNDTIIVGGLGRIASIRASHGDNAKK